MEHTYKDKILIEAIKLFSENTYEQVTFTVLEKHSKIKKATILYHYQSKNELFIALCNKFLFDNIYILSRVLSEEDINISLEKTIEKYILFLKLRFAYATSIGIPNFNHSLVNLSIQAKYFYPDFDQVFKNKYDEECCLWEKIIQSDSKFSTKHIDKNLIINKLSNTYMSECYRTYISNTNLDFEEIKKIFTSIIQIVSEPIYQ